MIRIAFAAALVSASLGVLNAADSPFTGKWKFNPAKSKATGQTDTIAADGPNAWKLTYGAFSWTIKADGTDQPTPFEATSALKVLGPTTWQFTTKVNGKVTGVDTWELAADAKTMLRKSASTRENGDANNSSTTVKRIAGTRGFEGTWQVTEATFSAPETFDLQVAGDTVTESMPSEMSKWTCKSDGVQCKVEGPKAPASLTVSVKRPSPSALAVTWRVAGKVVGEEEWRVSGSTLTMVEHDPGVKAPYVWVFERQ